MELDLEASIKVATDHLENIDAKTRGFKHKPYHLKSAVSTVALANTPTILSAGSPPSGMLWNLLSVAVVGADAFTVVASSTPALYVGDSANFGVGQLIRPAVTPFNVVPGVISFSDEVIWVHSTEEAFVVVTGAAAAQSLTAIFVYDMWVGEEA